MFLTTQTSKKCQFTSWICKLHHYPTFHSFPSNRQQIICHVTFFGILPLRLSTNFENWDVHVSNISRDLGKSCTFGLVLLCFCNGDEKYMLSHLTGPEKGRPQPRSMNPHSFRVMITRHIHIDSEYISNLSANLQICELVSALF